MEYAALRECEFGDHKQVLHLEAARLVVSNIYLFKEQLGVLIHGRRDRRGTYIHHQFAEARGAETKCTVITTTGLREDSAKMRFVGHKTCGVRQQAR